ncbi:MAG: heme ABC transporter permease CcmC [Phenylobacterium sp.]
MSWAPAFLSNPDRFMAISLWPAPLDCASADVLATLGLYFGFHAPAAWLSMFVYVCLAVASFLSLIFRHALADAAARAAAPLGAAFTLMALVTGALWGRPMWGTYWVWDARLTSVLVMFLIYVAYIALRASLDDEARAARAGAILALVGAINLPVVKFSVDWWNTLHQGAAVFRAEGPSLAPVYLWPLLIMALAYMAAFGSLWLGAIRAEVWRRRAEAAALRAARA